ncbi:hypothetical protein M758_6G124200 [Ceratodon purpureus]|uniref:Uncharacterized protein n=1 Tax=Ceratodon purpureus TaxID=3225 RepID=A0A8T0HIU8_CERPU|nr:hypothetical protein KC19_6G129300 [Ceratodon purpureus]KAG0613714.1 hypothetical protein M758_6G124200 [Ceratodon purpureus]
MRFAVREGLWFGCLGWRGSVLVCPCAAEPNSAMVVRRICWDGFCLGTLA